MRVKSLFSLLKLTGDSLKDFKEKKFKQAYKNSKIPEYERSYSSSDDDEKDKKLYKVTKKV